MARHLVRIVLLFSALLLTISTHGAHAYGLSGAGASLGYTTPEDFDGTFNVGAHLEFEQNDSRLHLQPSVRYWKVQRTSDLNLNGDLYYHLMAGHAVSPYVGTGLGLHVMNDDRTDRSDTSLGLNLFGGVRFPAAMGTTFLEVRSSIANTSQFGLNVGMTWRLH